ncbi:molybdopterin-dependent oxidoreductase [Trinickia dabaoshanensis]|nr:molybdopterin-dependent oxidoreductase [Trinickia dabaoshanensis]
MRVVVGWILLFIALAFRPAFASGDDAMLTVGGNIEHVTDQASHTYRFSKADLLALGTSTIKTSTNWTPVSVWRGPSLQSVLQKVGAHGEVLRVYALDDYEHDVPVSDVQKYGVILAFERNGVPLAPNKFGPLMLVYPRDAEPDALNRASIEARFVWQIYKIVVK